MDFSPVSTDTATQTIPAIRYVLSLDISPEDKKFQIQSIIERIGQAFYLKMFDANSEVFDSKSINTLGFANPEAQIERLALKIVRNYYLGRDIDYLVQDFYKSALGQAQAEAFANALSLDKHPTATRRQTSGQYCTWCQTRCGEFTNPPSSIFQRHKGCSCLIIVSGYNTRNGVLKNYYKRSNK